MKATSKLDNRAGQKSNSFPHFADGDVLIVLNNSLHCRLHSQVLANNSEIFRDMLSDATATKLTKASHTEISRVRWRFHLEITDPDAEDISLTRIPLNSDGNLLVSRGSSALRGLPPSTMGSGMPDPISEVSYITRSFGLPTYIPSGLLRCARRHVRQANCAWRL